MNRLPDGAGRTLFIAGLAGSIFAAFLIVTPKLATGGADVVGESIGGVPAATVAPVTTTTAATTTSALAVTTTTTPPPTTTLPATTTTTIAGEPMTPAFGYDGTVRLSVTATGPPGNESAIRDGDQISWTFQVTNTTDQELWGVFVWLELVGRAQCESHHLWPMGDTDCRVTSTAQAGEQTAEVWVDAWTTTRQVKDRVLFHYRVLAI